MPSRRFTTRACAVAICAAFLLPALSSAKNFEKPVAHSAINYPAHDFHRDVQVGMAADPYDTPEKAKVFTVDFAKHGLLPVFFVVTNDANQPLSIANIEITLITANHSKLTPLSPDDIFRRLANPQANTTPTPTPIPIPHKKVKGTISEKEREEIESSQFAAKAVEPHSTQSGFLFFDIQGISSPLADSNLDITGVEDAKGNEVMYFEISIEKYLHAPQNP
jgi:hypothetical protein